MPYMKTDRTKTVGPASESIVRQPDAEVTDDYVRSYIEAVDFFESLGGTEVVRRRKGVITVTSINPERTVTREVIFTPIVEGPAL